MPCRVGMTTNPERREREWRAEYPSLWGWTVEGGNYTKNQAQDRENQLAVQYGCQAHPGGDGSESDNWYVYWFYY